MKNERFGMIIFGMSFDKPNLNFKWLINLFLNFKLRVMKFKLIMQIQVNLFFFQYFYTN